MRFLLVSRTSSLLPVALRLQEEGHIVHLVSSDYSGEGIVPKTQLSLPFHLPSIRKVYLEGFDVGIVDHPSLYNVRRLLHKRIPTIGPTAFTCRLAMDKSFARKAFRIAGIEDEPETDGESIFTAGWFDGTSFGKVLFGGIFSQRLLSGDLGPVSYQPSQVVGWLYNYVPKIHIETLGKLERLLQKSDYRGPIGFLLGVDSQDFRIIETICDMRILQVFFEGIPKLGEFLLSIAKGQIKERPKWASYCSGGFGTFRKDSILEGLTTDGLKHLWLQNIYKPEGMPNGSLQTLVGGIGHAQAWGKDMREAKRRVMRELKDLKVPDIYYRIDIGKGAEVLFEKLRRWRWI